MLWHKHYSELKAIKTQQNQKKITKFLKPPTDSGKALHLPPQLSKNNLDRGPAPGRATTTDNYIDSELGMVDREEPSKAHLIKVLYVGAPGWLSC